MAAIEAPIPEDAVFDNVFGDLTKLLDPHTEAHRVAVMASFMSIFSAYIGKGPYVRAGRKKMPLSFWTILCGPTGKGRKGTATGLAMEIADMAIPTFINGQIQYGIDSGLGLIQELYGRINGETGTLAPEPLCFYEEEFSKVLEAAKKDRRFGATMTKLWDGSTIMHKTAKETYLVPNPHASFISHVQPKLLRSVRKSKDAAGGTYNRFVVLWSMKSKSIPTFEESAEYDAVIAEAVRMFRRICHGAADITAIRVSPELGRKFDRHHRPTMETLTSVSEEIAEFGERAVPYLLRIAGIYALAEKSEWIKEEHFDSALALMRYSVQSLQYVLSSENSFGGRTPLAEKVATVVKEHGIMTYSAMKALCSGTNTKATYIQAFIELNGEVVVFQKAMKGRGYRGGWWLAAKGQPLPEGSTIVDLKESDAEPSDTDDPTEHPNYKMPTEDVTEEAEIIVEEVTVIKEDPEPESEPRKAIAAPKPAKAAPKASTEDLRAAQQRWLDALLRKDNRSRAEADEIERLQEILGSPKPKPTQRSGAARRTAPHRKIPASTPATEPVATSWF